MISKMNDIPVPPLPSLNFTSSQLSMMQGTIQTSSYIDPVTGQRVTTTEGDFVNPDAPPGQFSGPEGSVTAPNTGGTASADAYSALITNLGRVIREASGGAWRASASNPNLVAMCRDLGATWGQPYGPRPAMGWCAMFVSYMLYKSGLPILVGGRTQRAIPRAQDWAGYGTRISNRDPRTWRKGDIILVGGGNTTNETASGRHVGFLWGANSSGNYIQLAGGNQGNDPGDVTISNRPAFLTNSQGGTGTRAVAVVRGWALPSSADVPLY